MIPILGVFLVAVITYLLVMHVRLHAEVGAAQGAIRVLEVRVKNLDELVGMRHTELYERVQRIEQRQREYQERVIDVLLRNTLVRTTETESDGSTSDVRHDVPEPPAVPALTSFERILHDKDE